MNLWGRFWGHLVTITRHRHKVIAHCAKAGILLGAQVPAGRIQIRTSSILL